VQRKVRRAKALKLLNKQCIEAVDLRLSNDQPPLPPREGWGEGFKKRFFPCIDKKYTLRKRLFDSLKLTFSRREKEQFLVDLCLIVTS
jgi:hypothetical protein